MRFFNDRLDKEYESFCRSIWDSVPLGLKLICKSMLPDGFDKEMRYCIHDGHIIKFEENKKTNDIELNLLIFDEYDSIRKIEEEHKLVLVYKNAKVIKKPQNCVGMQHDRDIMCHEISEYKEGRFIHSYLFPGGKELSIEFEGFELNEVDEFI